MAMSGARFLDFLNDTQWDDLPEPVRQMSVVCLRDLLGVAAGALQTDCSRIIRDHAVTHMASGNHGPSSRLLFDGREASPTGTAMAGAMSIDSLDAHDGYRPNKGHVGAWALPAILAMVDAEKNSARGGRDFLTLLAVGYELGSRLGVAQHATVPDYHASGSWGAVGSAALASRILGLNAGQTREAMGIAEYHSPRSQMMRCIDHPTMVKDSSGWGAMTGVSSTYLAQSGFTGAPALIVDSPECHGYWDDLGETWLILEQYFKPYPVCRWAQAAMVAAQTLRVAHDIAPDNIDRIEIATFHEGVRLNHPNPATTEQAQYSLPFPVAALLVNGKCGAEEVTSGLNDPGILALANRVHMVEDDECNRRFPAERLARATITLSDGRRFESEAVQADGDPETPLSPEEFQTKFDELAVPTLGRSGADDVWRLAGSLADDQPLQLFLSTVLSSPAHASAAFRTTSPAA